MIKIPVLHIRCTQSSLLPDNLPGKSHLKKRTFFLMIRLTFGAKPASFTCSLPCALQLPPLSRQLAFFKSNLFSICFYIYYVIIFSNWSPKTAPRIVFSKFFSKKFLKTCFFRFQAPFTGAKHLIGSSSAQKGYQKPRAAYTTLGKLRAAVSRCESDYSALSS